jgi:hypothetical protein
VKEGLDSGRPKEVIATHQGVEEKHFGTYRSKGFKKSSDFASKVEVP